MAGGQRESGRPAPTDAPRRGSSHTVSPASAPTPRPDVGRDPTPDRPDRLERARRAPIRGPDESPADTAGPSGAALGSPGSGPRPPTGRRRGPPAHSAAWVLRTIRCNQTIPTSWKVTPIDENAAPQPAPGEPRKRVRADPLPDQQPQQGQAREQPRRRAHRGDLALQLRIGLGCRAQPGGHPRDSHRQASPRSVRDLPTGSQPAQRCGAGGPGIGTQRSRHVRHRSGTQPGPAGTGSARVPRRPPAGRAPWADPQRARRRVPRAARRSGEAHPGAAGSRDGGSRRVPGQGSPHPGSSGPARSAALPHAAASAAATRSSSRLTCRPPADRPRAPWPARVQGPPPTDQCCVHLGPRRAGRHHPELSHHPGPSGCRARCTTTSRPARTWACTPARVIPAARANATSRSGTAPRAVRMHGAAAALVTGVHRCQQVHHLGTAHLTDHEPVRAHPQRLTDQRAHRDLAPPLEIGRPRLHADHMRVAADRARRCPRRSRSGHARGPFPAARRARRSCRCRCPR